MGTAYLLLLLGDCELQTIAQQNFTMFITINAAN